MRPAILKQAFAPLPLASFAGKRLSLLKTDFGKEGKRQRSKD
jgi:hypothetical protein